MRKIEIVQDDIFEQDVDAIVNPANELMMHAGGLAAVIAKRAGKSVVQQSLAQAPVKTGEAIMTSAGHLPFAAVIHAVGEVFHEDRERQCAELLWRAYVNAVHKAAFAGLGSLAFPAISGGIFGYPAKKAAPVAIDGIRWSMQQSPIIRRVVVCVPEDDKFAAYRKAARWRRWVV